MGALGRAPRGRRRSAANASRDVGAASAARPAGRRPEAASRSRTACPRSDDGRSTRPSSPERGVRPRPRLSARDRRPAESRRCADRAPGTGAPTGRSRPWAARAGVRERRYAARMRTFSEVRLVAATRSAVSLQRRIGGRWYSIAPPMSGRARSRPLAPRGHRGSCGHAAAASAGEPARGRALVPRPGAGAPDALPDAADDRRGGRAVLHEPAARARGDGLRASTSGRATASSA